MRGTAETRQQIPRLGSGVCTRGCRPGWRRCPGLLSGCCLDVNAKIKLGWDAWMRSRDSTGRGHCSRASHCQVPVLVDRALRGILYHSVVYAPSRSGMEWLRWLPTYRPTFPIPNPNGSAARPTQVPKFNTIQIAQDSNACRPSRNPCNALRDCHVVDWPLLVRNVPSSGCFQLERIVRTSSVERGVVSKILPVPPDRCCLPV